MPKIKHSFYIKLPTKELNELKERLGRDLRLSDDIRFETGWKSLFKNDDVPNGTYVPVFSYGYLDDDYAQGITTILIEYKKIK